MSVKKQKIDIGTEVDAVCLRKWLETVQRNNVAFRAKSSWMAQNGTVLATLDERSPIFLSPQSQAKNVVVYTSLFTTEWGTRLCDVTPISAKIETYHPVIATIENVNPRVVKELFGPRTWRLFDLETKYDCFLDVSSNREKITITTLPGIDANEKNRRAVKDIQAELGAIRERLCAAAHIFSYVSSLMLSSKLVV